MTRTLAPLFTNGAVFAVVSCVVCIQARAQTGHVSVWAGYSFDAGGPLSPVQTLDFAAVGVELSTVVGESRAVLVEHLLGIVPAALVLRNLLGPVSPHGGHWHFAGTRQRTTTYGVGASPVGLRVTIGHRRRVAGFVNLALGAMWFTRPAPASNTHIFNFTIDAGAGLRVVLNSGRAIALGYRLQHLSNGGLGPMNPGLDSKILYVRVDVTR